MKGYKTSMKDMESVCRLWRSIKIPALKSDRFNKTDRYCYSYVIITMISDFTCMISRLFVYYICSCIIQYFSSLFSLSISLVRSYSN